MSIHVPNKLTCQAVADDQPKPSAPDTAPRRLLQLRTGCRKAAAAVEFAIVAPFLFLTVIIPTIEFGRGFMVSEMLTNAARSGCRAGVLPGNSNANVTTAVNNSLTSVSGATTTVAVNGTIANCNTATAGNSITVTVSVPYSSVSWIPGSFLPSKTLTGSQTMRHE